MAINAVNSGRSTREVGRSFGLAESTIRLRMKTGNTSAAVLGRKPVLSPEQEKELADYVITVANMFYGLTPVELQRFAYEFAEANNIKHAFNTTTNMAGKEWLQLF